MPIIKRYSNRKYYNTATSKYVTLDDIGQIMRLEQDVQIVDHATGDDLTALVLSQVVLSFGLPFAVVPLIMFTRRRDVMGALVNRRLTTALAIVAATVIIALNIYLLYQTFFGA